MTLIEISLQPSRLLLAVLVLAHSAALIVALSMPLPQWVTLAVSVAVMVSMAHAIWHHCLLRDGKAAHALKVSGGRMEVMLRGGVWFPARVLDNSYVSPWLTVLNLELEGRKPGLAVLLLPDSTDADNYRRLRAWLRWGGALRNGAERAGML